MEINHSKIFTAWGKIQWFYNGLHLKIIVSKGHESMLNSVSLQRTKLHRWWFYGGLVAGVQPAKMTVNGCAGGSPERSAVPAILTCMSNSQQQQNILFYHRDTLFCGFSHLLEQFLAFRLQSNTEYFCLSSPRCLVHLDIYTWGLKVKPRWFFFLWNSWILNMTLWG